LFAMNALTVVSTDLLTPLGAYLRLRERGRASFCSSPWSADGSAATRSSVPGPGSSISRKRRRAVAGRRLPAMTTRPCWSRPCSSQTPAAASPRAGSSSPRRWSGSTTGSGWRKCWQATRPRSSTSSMDRSRKPRAAAADWPGRHVVSPRGTSTSAPSSRRRSTSAPATRSRSSSHSAPSGRRLPARSSSTARFAVSTRRRISSSWSSATTSRSWAPRPRRWSRRRGAAPR
jgi:hypothetical protein